VIAIATTAIPPAGVEANVKNWVTETLSAFDRQLLETSVGIVQLRADINTRVLDSACACGRS
jgi:hypothetical protein